MSWLDREQRRRAELDDVPLTFTGVPQLYLEAAEFLAQDQPDVDWPVLLALTWRIESEYPNMCAGCGTTLMADRSWVEEVTKGADFATRGHDGTTRLYRVTDLGRSVAREVLP